MLRWLVEQKKAIQLMTQETNMGVGSATVMYPDEWELCDLLTILVPFEEVTVTLSQDQTSISEVILVVYALGTVKLVQEVELAQAAGGSGGMCEVLTLTLMVAVVAVAELLAQSALC
ncbi:UNVERIFIED_CONTAM: hypothetical protein FKN15_036111 [Acipenser sinensis]